MESYRDFEGLSDSEPEMEGYDSDPSNPMDNSDDDFYECLECGKHYQKGASGYYCDDCLRVTRYHDIDLWKICTGGSYHGWKDECKHFGHIFHHVWEYKNLRQYPPVRMVNGQKMCGCPRCLSHSSS